MLIDFDKTRPKLFTDDIVGLVVANKLMGIDNIDWFDIIKKYDLNDDFIWTYKDYINEFLLFNYQYPSEELIIKLIDYYGIYDSNDIDADFEDNHSIDIRNLIMQRLYSFDFIMRYKNNWNWEFTWRFQRFTEDEIESLMEIANWDIISEKQKLSIPFILKHRDKVNWLQIYLNQELTEEFIINMGHKTYWDAITSHQTYLSEEFIEKHSNEINFNWRNIARFQKNISKEFIENHRLDIMKSKKFKDGYKKQRD